MSETPHEKPDQSSAGQPTGQPAGPLGAFCPHGPVADELTSAASGPLAGVAMAVKDLFDIAGHATGFGNPTWLSTHEPAARTASAVQRLLDAGAEFKGKTICDELCFSLNGENMHYGTPRNVMAPGRLPGGSSSGSAAAVAGGIVDFALGSDTGGSVRLPASYCGVYGIRTTHGRIACDGVTPLAASFDVVGWLARDPQLMQLVGSALFSDPKPAAAPCKLLILDDAFEIAGAAVADALLPAVRSLQQAIGNHQHIRLGSAQAAGEQAASDQPASDMIGREHDGCELNGSEQICQWADDFRLLQGAEIWATHGRWITRHKPAFAPAIAARLKWTASLAEVDLAPAKARQQAWQQQAALLLPPGHVICLPIAPGPAPLRHQPPDALEDHRHRLIPLLCLAGLAGLPQISLPLATIEDCPLGLGVIAGTGQDETLLALAGRINIPAERRGG